MSSRLAIWFTMLAMMSFSTSLVYSGDTGIVYGRNGNNLPSPKQVIDFLSKQMKNSISLIRVYDANLEVLEALAGTNLVVTIGVPNEAIAHVASSQEAADKWFQDHIMAYINKGVRFRYICVGNEAVPGLVQSLVQQAICNLHNSVMKCGIDYIHVTTAVGMNVLSNSYPPSSGQFAPEAETIMNSLTSYLYSIGSPLLINVYPYYSLIREPQYISLDYALFQSQTPKFKDGNLEYYNLFDATVDAFLAAMARAVQKEDVKVVVAETGWPICGSPYASVENAQIYNRNLRKHAILKGWTPRKSDINLEVYIFEMFNENLNTDEAGLNFGTFYPNFTQVYPLWDPFVKT